MQKVNKAVEQQLDQGLESSWNRVPSSIEFRVELKCMRTRSSRSTEDLVELDLQRVERGFRGHRGYKRNLRCLLLIQWMYQRGMETLWEWTRSS
ncbi:unnamed protein product [Microthlaspi erraticum]|uniref:Uncharacterized protein n=1 Tax=Microthlaspi erraticum TaxID=1685480 RepID=A0A6D2HQJ3_9BRAS|nr:unnamed protein product [Microthlaspi erraticum]